MARQRHRGAFVFGAVLGGLAGAAFGLWTAPRPGVERRERLKAQARELAHQAGQALSALREEGERLVESAIAAIAAIVEPTPEPEQPAAPTDRRPFAPTDEVIAAATLPPVSEPPTDEVIEGPYPAPRPQPHPPGGDPGPARDATPGESR